MREDPAYLCSNRSQNAPLLTPQDAHDAEAILHNPTAFDRVENFDMATNSNGRERVALA